MSRITYIDPGLTPEPRPIPRRKVEAMAIARQAAALTLQQLEALIRIRDRGPCGWDFGIGRAGGAVSRMFDRMAEAGLCTPPPHKITKLGRKVVAARVDSPSRISAVKA